MNRLFLLFGAVSGFLTVAMGAFGGHLLRGDIEPRLYEAFQTGVEYQGVHTVTLLVIAVLEQRTASLWLTRSGWLILAGITLFSGSLYLMALSGVRALGMITPIGGVALLLGWLALAITALQIPKRKPE
jgi:uncharacterized membrane protein YgdD (TMEM256/DUF423 family)